MPSNIRSLLLEDLQQWVDTRGFEPYRAAQLAGWLYNRDLIPVEQMHNLPSSVRDALCEDFSCSAASTARKSVSTDGTVKFLVKLHDGRVVESVLIPRDERLTLCISSQAGCALGCDFCATAQLGLLRNLEPFEIVSQVLLARPSTGGHPITNYVFMGMGEPLANYDRVLRAIAIMTARWGLGISPRRITVSTVGLAPQLEQLVRDSNVHIAISLTAARDELRDRLMPINRKYSLMRLMDTCRKLELPRRKRVTFEYVMLNGINDSDRDIDDLTKLFHGLAVKLNLIPFNPFAGSPYMPSSPERVEEFRNRLSDRGIHTTVRVSRGRDIDAACGQLAASGE